MAQKSSENLSVRDVNISVHSENLQKLILPHNSDQAVIKQQGQMLLTITFIGNYFYN
jgi:hypothetical protein